MKRSLAVGHFYNEPFQSACAPWLNRIAEVFFAWPGVLSCRPAPEFTPEVRARLLSDLHWCRDNGIRLDTLFNCLCYGDISVSTELADFVTRTLGEMDREGLFPDVVTTTSPFIASIVKARFPSVRIRASVNMRIHGTIGFEALGDLFDEYYISREYQRNLDYVDTIAKWCHDHGKLIGAQANSGCLRQCPFQTFHDNLHGHNRIRQSKVGEQFDFDIFRCRTHYTKERKIIDFLRSTWLRPEDIPLWEERLDLIKLATRRTPHPTEILNAYASYRYDGNLIRLMDPHYEDAFAPGIVDNRLFPKDWATSGIAADCANNCTNCGRCEAIWKTIYHS